MTQSKIAVIVLNWNNAPDTLECLASVYQSQNVAFEVYVVDNGSTDDSLQKIREAFPQATFLAHGKNLGFAEGNNRAIERAIKEGAEYIFLLNNDATLHENALAILLDYAKQHPEAAALGPKVYFDDRPTTLWYGGGDWDLEGAKVFHHEWGVEDAVSATNVQDTSYIVGCTLFAPVHALKKVGLMDPRFFLNWEEIDWCWRMRKMGYKCLYIPEAKAWHKITRSFPEGKKGALWLYFYWRNRFLWMEKNLTKEERKIAWRSSIFPQLKQLIRKSLHGNEKNTSRAALRGVFDYFRRSFGPPPSFLLRR